MNLGIIGTRIKEAREHLGLTQEELAARIGKTQNSISLYEKGSRAIRVSELDDLAKALEVPVSYFFGDIYPEDEIMSLVAQFSPEERKKIAARLRLELRLQQETAKTGT